MLTLGLINDCSNTSSLNHAAYLDKMRMLHAHYVHVYIISNEQCHLKIVVNPASKGIVVLPSTNIN